MLLATSVLHLNHVESLIFCCDTCYCYQVKGVQTTHKWIGNAGGSHNHQLGSCFISPLVTVKTAYFIIL